MSDFADPVEELLQCHREIMGHTGRLRKALENFRSGGSAEDMRLTLDVFLLFMRTILRSHKADEEMALFPLMRELGCPEDELRRLVDDHEDISSMGDFINLVGNIDKSGKGQIEKRLSEAIEKLEDHVRQEEEFLYSLAKKRLKKSHLRELSERMESLRDS